ncbi:MAG TPA: ABC transporter permease [Gemmatimonadaceae bacterium]|jgi:predicted permease
MSLIDSLRYRLSIVLAPRVHDRELGEEMDFHLDLESMQQAHRTHDAANDASFAARRRFGNVTHYREESRRASGFGIFDALWQDARFALRTFRRTPTFTFVVIATLAIGIGANTAIFSVFDALLLRPLPYRDPSRLVNVSLVAPLRGGAPGPNGITWSVPKFTVFRSAQNTFSDLALVFGSQFTIRVHDDAVRDAGEVVDTRYLPLLGIRPTLGRGLLESDDVAGAPRVVLISDAFWQNNFNADPSVLGHTMEIDGSTFTIVGVLQPGFTGVINQSSFWFPLRAMPKVWEDFTSDPYNHSFFGIARLAEGVSLDRAKVAAQALGARVDAAYPNPRTPNEHWSAAVRPLDVLRVDPSVRRAVFILFGAAVLVLLIACANVANLFLVRATGRQREIAVRLAIGASRRRLIRQLLVEGLVLSMLGGVAALLVAWIGTRFLASSNMLDIQRLGGVGDVGLQGLRLDQTALLFTAAVTVFTGAIFGLAPALQSTKPSLTSALKDDAGAWTVRLRGVTGRNVLTVVELTLAVVLLAGSGLMIRSLRQLTDVNPGFASDHLLTLRVNRAPDWSRDSIGRFYDLALTRLATIPGVRQVAMSDCPPLNPGCGLRRDVRTTQRSPGQDGGTAAGIHWISPDWSTVMHVPLLRGRLFDRNDDAHSRKVVLVSASAAQRMWPGLDPIGRPVTNFGSAVSDTAWVIGVLGDVLYGSLNYPPGPEIFVSYFQAPLSYRMMFFLRTDGDPQHVTDDVRRALREIAPGFPMYETETMEWRIGATLAYPRAATTLLALFATVALVLATIGTYGVISFGVAHRKREMSVRLALGATTGDLVRLVVGQGVTLGAVGLGCGVVAALGATRVLRTMLYGVAPTDPVTYVAIVAVLSIAIIVASFAPARRAAGVPAMTALRTD